MRTIFDSFFCKSSSALSKNPHSSNKEIWTKIFYAENHHEGNINNDYKPYEKLHIPKHTQITEECSHSTKYNHWNLV